MRDALARRSASIMIKSSIRWWFVGGDVDCTRKTSSPRTFSSILTNVSPSGKALTVHFPSSVPMYFAMASANGGLEVPLNIFTISSWFLGAENKKPPLRWVANRKLCGDCTYDPRSRKRNLADSGILPIGPVARFYRHR